MEPEDSVASRVPAAFRDRAPRYPKREIGDGFQAHPGGSDPNARLKEMARDGVSAEVLYPTNSLGLFQMEDAALQEACCQAYNDWLIEYCQADRIRLVGVPIIATYNMEQYLRQAIDSILAQDYPNLELIIVDAG